MLHQLIQLRYLKIVLTLHFPATSHTARPSKGPINSKPEIFPVVNVFEVFDESATAGK